jgi:hypothetical protein
MTACGVTARLVPKMKVSASTSPREAKHDENQVKGLSYRLCRKAGLPERGWHCLRHTFGTHAAIFGVNQWRLMSWMGHKLINETHRYVHVADAHMRALPPAIQAATTEPHADRRILKMLGARMLTPVGWGVLTEVDSEICGTRLAPEAENEKAREESPGLSLV